MKINFRERKTKRSIKQKQTFANIPMNIPPPPHSVDKIHVAKATFDHTSIVMDISHCQQGAHGPVWCDSECSTAHSSVATSDA